MHMKIEGDFAKSSSNEPETIRTIFYLAIFNTIYATPFSYGLFYLLNRWVPESDVILTMFTNFFVLIATSYVMAWIVTFYLLHWRRRKIN